MNFEKVQPLCLRSAPGKTTAPSTPTTRSVLTATAVALALGLVALSARSTTTSDTDAVVVAPASSTGQPAEDRLDPPLQSAGTASRAR